MGFVRSRGERFTAHVNDVAVAVGPRETLLQAALRHGVDFPHSCRVGGCGTCRCRLTAGRVRELTETGYLLSGDEIERGTILACQSVPLTDLRVEVDLGPQETRRSVEGRVVGQGRVTRDITRLEVQLDGPLPYRAGQHAALTLEGVTRTYSFATAARSDGRLAFYVRRVPGGAFSCLVNDHDVVGRAVRVEGPSGDFWLRPSDAPLLLVAGGSGLAPILAMLEEAAAAGVSRPVTLLFGARTEQDLYALAEIEALARGWNGSFRFVPVLSDEPGGTTWAGARGLVADAIPEVLEPGAHAYLCGPSAMVDAAMAQHERRGVPREHVHVDRFTPHAGAGATSEGRSPAGVLHYLKFFGFHGVGLFSAAAILAGGHRITAGLLAVVAFYIVGDAVCGDDTSTPRYRHPGILTAQLWLALPLLTLIVFAAVWSVSPGDPLGFGAWLSERVGHDLLAARDGTTFGHHVSAWVLTGLMIGMVGTITAHELTHRTWDPVSMLVGRWLLAFSFDTTFSIEHVYGHHRYVSTAEDPATAPRGRNVYAHIVASTVRGNLSAWRIERERLEKRKLGVYSLDNAVIRGQLMSLTLVVAAWAMGGLEAAAFFVACALWGKALLEIVNYMEHYGMVRDPEQPVEPRHSWNTNRRLSSWTLFNLTRHSHHHGQGEVPYQDLEPLPDAPEMVNGYLTTIVVALIPPLWHALMTPKVLAWDRHHASARELELAARANARSGIPALERAAVAG